VNGLKALVLAGGFGTRLRPLSCTRPKLLLPVANQPAIDWTLRDLSAQGVDTVILAVNYMAEAFVRYFGPSKFNLGIQYSREERPLGTGGPIRRAESHFRGGEPFLVLNGDVISSIDYNRLLEFHKEKGGLATIALHEVSDPSRYGAVELDGRDRVRRFVEKPRPGEEPSNLVNAGIYVFDPKVIEYIPTGRSVSTELEVFPRLAEEGQLYGFEFRDLWVDIGLPEDYLAANALLLAKENGAKVGKGATVDPSAEVLSPSIIGENVKIGGKSVIGPNCAIADNVEIGSGCRIENSIIFPGTCIGDFTSVRSAILGENVMLERWVKIEEGSIIGDHASIGDGVTITCNVSICPSKRVEESILQPGPVM
jgi:mannose-1-phosphate guanylyltransferase